MYLFIYHPTYHTRTAPSPELRLFHALSLAIWYLKKVFHVNSYCFHKIRTFCSAVPHKGTQCPLISLLGFDDFDCSMLLPKPHHRVLVGPQLVLQTLPCIPMVHTLLCTHSDPLELWVRLQHSSAQDPVMVPVSLGVSGQMLMVVPPWCCLHLQHTPPTSPPTGIPLHSYLPPHCTMTASCCLRPLPRILSPNVSRNIVLAFKKRWISPYKWVISDNTRVYCPSTQILFN